MIFNVAQLMKSQVGASFDSEINEEHVRFDDELKVIGPLIGHVRMRRINQGLLVDGWADVTLEQSCTRCLELFELPMHITLEERFFPTVDVVTGIALPPINEDDVFPIDDHHLVDLTEAIRQQILLNLPMVTLCKPDCAGLCVQCGQNLNLGSCGCEPEIDHRMSVLKTLLENEF